MAAAFSVFELGLVLWLLLLLLLLCTDKLFEFGELNAECLEAVKSEAAEYLLLLLLLLLLLELWLFISLNLRLFDDCSWEAEFNTDAAVVVLDGLVEFVSKSLDMLNDEDF